MTKRRTLLDDMTDAERKAVPLAEMLTDYFPDAMIELARMCAVGQRQHNPGKPLSWDKKKSSDHANTLLRHFLQRGTRDTDGERHSTKVLWRAAAALQIEIEEERARTEANARRGATGRGRRKRSRTARKRP